MVRLLLLILLAWPAAAAVVHVRAGAGGTGDGGSWANAYPSLAAALAAAVAGDEVWVAAGTHRVEGGRNSHFPLKDRVPVYGGFLGSETARDQRSRDATLTVLSGERGGAQAEDDALYVITGWGGDMLLDGVTVTGNWNDYTASNIGGALWIEAGSSVLLSNCRFVGCSGTYISAIDISVESIRLEDVVIAGNRSSSTTIAASAVRLKASSITCERCLVAGNQAQLTAGGALVTVGNCTFRDCAVVGNSGGGW